MPVQANSGGFASMAVWIERADGTILRGSAETVSARSARVRIPGRHAFCPDEHVLLRICFSPERPTVAASAQVRWARQLGEASVLYLYSKAPAEMRALSPDAKVIVLLRDPVEMVCSVHARPWP